MFGGAVYVGYIIKTVGHVALDIEDSFFQRCRNNGHVMGRREQENRKRKAAAKSCQSLDTWVSKVQSTPDNSNLQRKLKKGSSYREFELSGSRRK